MKLFRREGADDLREKLTARRGEISAALAEVKGRISEAERERASLRASPITRDDYARAVLADIDRRADEQLAGMARHFLSCAQGITDNSRSAASVAKVQEAQRRSLPTLRESLFGRPLNLQGSEGDALQSPAAYALFRDEIKRAASEAITRIEPWPFPDAVPLESAQSRLREIETTLTDLRAEEAALIAEAEEFGAGT
jgi:hypothetical protein